MQFSHDRRGQSVVVGTVVLFGFLIVAMAVYQAQIVPMDNANIEFEHSQEVENDIGDLRDAILRASSTGSAQPQRVRLGTRYPQRTFFVNPPPATGEIRTTAQREIRFEGVAIDSGAHDNVIAFWDTNPNYSTRSIQYRPNYNEYREAPELTYEHSIVAAEFPNQAIQFRTNQTVIRSDRLSLTAVTGETSENAIEGRSIDPEAVSSGSRTVPVSVESGDAIVLPTALHNETRAAALWDERLTDKPVTATAVEGSSEIRLEFTETTTFRLRLSEIAIDGDGATEPAYVVPVDRRDVVVGDSVGVEVRDRYNNPVADTAVSFDGTERVTNDDGRAFYPATTEGTISATILDGSESYESVEFDVSAAGEGSPTQFDVRWTNDAPVSVVEDETEELTVTIEDRVSEERIRDARIDYSVAPLQSDPRYPTLPLETTEHDGSDTIEFDATGLQADDQFDVYAAAGDDTDRIRVNVVSAIEPPAVRTDPATNVGETEATLNGELTALGSASEVDVLFQYRETGSTTWINTSTQTRTTTGTFDETITGLDADTEYEFRAIAESTDGTDAGVVLTFSTTAEPVTPPSVETNSATGITTDSATLNGELTDLGTASEVDVSFQYRESGETVWTDTGTQTLTTTGTFDETVTGLEPGTVYEFRAVAESADGSDLGAIFTFETDASSDAPFFETLTTSSTNNQVTFNWDVSGDFTLVTLETQPNTANQGGVTTSTQRTGSATLPKQGGQRLIRAIVEGPGGTETCDTEIGNNEAITKDDFTCTTT